MTKDYLELARNFSGEDELSRLELFSKLADPEVEDQLEYRALRLSLELMHSKRVE